MNPSKVTFVLKGVGMSKFYTLFFALFLCVTQLGSAIDLGLHEANGETIECYAESELDSSDGVLENWGENVSFKPKYTFVPKTKQGISNIVKWASEQNLKIRVSGYRHTWNPVYPDDGQILISLLGLDYVDSNKASYVVDGNTGAGDELRTIAFVPGAVESDKILVKVGGAVTNDELRDFCLHRRDPFRGRFWAIPSNTILVENTFSGTISSICHGAGYQNQTLSDLVEEIEFVNAKGELQVVNKQSQPEQMKAAAGSFGLLGVITSITLKLDPMGYALTDPKLVKLAKAIPPPAGTRLEDMPYRLRKDLGIKDQQSLDTIIAENSDQFFAHCTDYYSEWFWFILTDDCWMNTWNKDAPENNRKNYEEWLEVGEQIYSHLKSWLQIGMTSFVELFNKDSLKLPSPPFQEYFVRCSNDVITGMLSTNPHTLPLPEALHFQQGIRHHKVRDVEIEIPVPLNREGQPDWTICQKAWWDAIYAIYRHLGDTETLPVNLTLEMRIMGGSNITMAAQRGNHYTCSIEVLSTMLVPHRDWKAMAEKIIALWISYTDSENNPLNIRTHWAKEWHGLQFDGKDSDNFVRETYRDAIPEFKQQLSEIAAAGGYSLDDMQQMFSNTLWDKIIFAE